MLRTRLAQKGCLQPASLLCVAVGECLEEEDGSVFVQDDLEALLTVGIVLVAVLTCGQHNLAKPVGCPLLSVDTENCGLLQVLPEDIRHPVAHHSNRAQLLEVSLPPQSHLTDVSALHLFASNHLLSSLLHKPMFVHSFIMTVPVCTFPLTLSKGALF